MKTAVYECEGCELRWVRRPGDKPVELCPQCAADDWHQRVVDEDRIEP